jgi:hypothetical protein
VARGKPIDWNVMVVGAWNRAILTPAGIAQRLFQLSPDTPIDIEMAFDRPGFMRAVHDGIAVEPRSNGLAVSPALPTLPNLTRAAQVAARALASLPDTPVSAAGVNLRFAYDPAPSLVAEALASPLDRRFSDADFQVKGRVAKRTVTWRDGVLNFDLIEQDSKAVVQFNFHRDSAVPADLRAWLEKTEEMFHSAARILENVVGVQAQLAEEEDVDE